MYYQIVKVEYIRVIIVTKLLVLAMLSIKSMSGYDIKEMLKLIDAERWSGILIGSIYNALNKLEKDGYVEVSRIEATGHRQKAIYRITKEGSEYEKQLIIESLEKSSVVYPTLLYSGISFAYKLENKEAVVALEKQHNILLSEYKSLMNGLEAKKEATENDISPYTMLVFNNMFETIKLQQKFVDQAINLIKNKQS